MYAFVYACVRAWCVLMCVRVQVSGGILTLRTRTAAWPNASWPAGYGNFTTSALHSLALADHGMFEVKSRSGRSCVSSSFWFHQNDAGACVSE